jgi:kumamolisin
MRRSSVVAIPALAIVLASVMVLSPLGSPLAADVEKDVSSGLIMVGAALGAMFPQAVMVGPMPQSENLRVGVSLPLQNQEELASFIQATSTPDSPGFRQFITPAEFSSTYSPSETSYLQLESYFEGYGLHMETSSNRLVLGVTGDPAQMGKAFHTTFADYRFPQGGTFYGTASAPQLPLSLGVSGAYGFSNALFNRPAYISNPVPSGGNGNIPLACSGGDTPAQVESAYGVNTLLSGGHNGTGEKIGIVDDYDKTDPQTTLASDISTFDSDCSLPSATVVYNYPVLSTTYNTSSADNGDGTETDLDMQMSHLMAPAATLDVTFSPDDGNGLYQALDSLVADDIVNAITISWGESDFGNDNGGSCSYECNASTDGSYAIVHPMMEAAAAEGISVFVASGDCGAADGTKTTTTDYPSSDEDVTGVGGTVLNLTGSTYKSEWGWSGNESSCPNNDGGAGGGWAPTPQPWYQYGYGIPHKTLRGVPDVGITAGTALVAEEDGSQVGDYGTSDAAPMWAGLTAIADQIHGGDVGLLNPILYSILRSSSYNSSFHDITTGYNGYKAGPGWDPITGVGTPIANVAIPEIASGGPAVTQTGLQATLTPSTTTPAAKASVTFTVTASGGTGTFPKYTFNFGDGNSTTTSKTTTTHAYASDGAYAANVEAFDSQGNSTASPFVQLSVGTTPFTITLTANVTATTVGSQVKLTSAPSGGSTPYSLEYYFGDGSNSPMSTASTTFLHAYYSPGVYDAQVTGTDSKSPADGATSNVVAITVTGAPAATLNSVVVSPAAPTVGTSSATPFTATPTCSSTCPGGIAYAWALSSTTLGSITGTGATVTFDSGTTAGTVGLFVNATLGGTTKGTFTIITVTTAPITLISVSVSPASPTVTEGGTQPFTATPTCSATCPATVTYVWALTSTTLGSISGSGATDTFTAGSSLGTVGLYVNATLSSTTVSASTVITVAASTITLTGVTLSPTTPTVASGSQTTFTATPQCTPSCPSSGIIYTWALSSTSLGSLSGSGTTDTFTAGTTAGTVSIYVNATFSSIVQGANTWITVTGPTLNSVSLSPTAPTVSASSKTVFSATPACAPSCPSSGIVYAWSLSSTALGSLSGGGAGVTFTALTYSGTVGIFVNATLGSTKADATTVITVTGSGPVLNSVSIGPATLTIAVGKTQEFTATPSCAPTCPSSGISYAWSLTSSALGSISGSGITVTFTAGTVPVVGGLFVNATLNGTTQGASSAVTVTAIPVTLTSVSVSPSSASINTGSSEEFTATPVCSASGSVAACPSGIAYAWELSNSDGSVSPGSGSSPSTVFTAGSANGTVVLTVTSSLGVIVVTASATITISSPGATTSPGTTTSSGTSSMLLIVVVAVAAVAAAIVVGYVFLRRKPDPLTQNGPLPPWNEL